MPNGNPAPGPLNSRYFRPVRGKETRARRWDLQFESTSLQRRVRKLSVPRFPCVHAAATTPVQQMGRLVAQTCPIHISLPRFHYRVGLHIVLFEVCSAFTRVAACTLAQSPNS
jgi:hypothetical protein